jgi:hypothetical protein
MKSLLLEAIRKNNARMDPDAVRRVLILYEPEYFYIGDCCVHFRSLELLRLYFSRAEFDFNYCLRPVEAIALHNPLLRRSYYRKPHQELLQEDYDVILCGAEDESKFVRTLVAEYQQTQSEKLLNLCAFSISRMLTDHPYTILETLTFTRKKHLNALLDRPTNQIFVTEQEQAWAAEYLATHGVNPGDNLVVLLDRSSKNIKQLNTVVYFQLIELLGTFRNTKFLIYDHENVDKEKFYSGFLRRNKSLYERLIFVKQTSLRESIVLLASEKIKAIIGPCTGLLHCATGIYTVFRNHNRIREEDIPIMLTYCGRNENGTVEAEYAWWGNTLVDCIKLKAQGAHRKQICLLTEEDKDVERLRDGIMYCKDYESLDLYRFIIRQYGEKLRHFNLL